MLVMDFVEHIPIFQIPPHDEPPLTTNTFSYVITRDEYAWLLQLLPMRYRMRDGRFLGTADIDEVIILRGIGSKKLPIVARRAQPASARREPAELTFGNALLP
jgi:hypothetical protein